MGVYLTRGEIYVGHQQVGRMNDSNWGVREEEGQDYGHRAEVAACWNT